MSMLGQMSENLPRGSSGAIVEFVEHNEAGVALETLCSQIHEYGIALSGSQKKQQQQAAVMLGIPLAQLDGLVDQATEISILQSSASTFAENIVAASFALHHPPPVLTSSHR